MDSLTSRGRTKATWRSHIGSSAGSRKSFAHARASPYAGGLVSRAETIAPFLALAHEMTMLRAEGDVLLAAIRTSSMGMRRVTLTTRIAVRGALLLLVGLIAAVIQPRDWMEARGIVIGAIVLLLLGERIVSYLRYR
jgi:hypothetical protein